MSQVFISYSHEDRPFAAQLARALAVRGVRVWIDVQDIPPGLNWCNEINRGLDVSSVLTLIESPAAMASVQVEREWQHFVNHLEKPVLLARYQPTPKLPYVLSGVQHVDFWKVSFDEAFERLCEALGALGAPVPSTTVDGGTLPLAAGELMDLVRSEMTPEQSTPLSRSTPRQAAALGRLALLEASAEYLTDLTPPEMCFVHTAEWPPSGGTRRAAPTAVAAFYIARCATTNAEWRRFVDANGYGEPAWWTPGGWEWIVGQRRSAPAFWEDSRLNAPKNPAVGISWHEAVAYCRWLASDSGYNVRLPLESEWAIAASWDPSDRTVRKYPWGDLFRKGLCNLAHVGAEGTRPVGTYSPEGDSPCGAADLAGNVQEWTLSLFANEGDDSDYDAPGHRVTRGGSWMMPQSCAEASCRGHYRPSSVERDIGLRPIIALAR